MRIVLLVKQQQLTAFHVCQILKDNYNKEVVYVIQVILMFFRTMLRVFRRFVKLAIIRAKLVYLPRNFVRHVNLIQTDNIVLWLVVYAKQDILMHVYLFVSSVVINAMIVQEINIIAKVVCLTQKEI